MPIPPGRARAFVLKTAVGYRPRVPRMTITTTACCIVGGGPGGMMLALLLARQGVEVVLLEAQQTFERAFRGDTVHPSTLELLDELGLMERLLALPHVGGSDFPI